MQNATVNHIQKETTMNNIALTYKIVLLCILWQKVQAPEIPIYN